MRLASSLLAASLTVLCQLGPSNPGACAQSSEADEDAQVLQNAGLATDGAALLAFFQSRARTDSRWEDLLALTRELGKPETGARAAAQLLALGPQSIPALRHAVNDLDSLERVAKAQQCLLAIEGNQAGVLPSAAARLLAVRKPAGAVPALLTYLPFADDANVAEAAGAALAELAYEGGQAHSALLRALEDPLPVRRSAAAEALCRGDKREHLPAVRKLLTDPKTLVRLRVALALARRQDGDAVSVLIDLLAELPAALRRPADEFLEQLAGEWAPSLAATGDDPIARRIRRDAWAGWWRNTDGPALLAEFRKNTLSPAERDRVQALIDRLGDDAFAVREKAVAELIEYGPRAIALLESARKGADLEKVSRAEFCLQRISRGSGKRLPSAAARLLAFRKPAGAVETLLAYAPFAEDETMLQELRATLTLLAPRDGALDPALVRALDDPLPARRALAAESLSRAPGGGAAARRLLSDADLGVRLRAALALATGREKEAIPVLIDLLPELPLDQGWQALETLSLLAGANGPAMALGEDRTARRKCRDAWAAWYRQNGPTLNLAALDGKPHTMGYTLLVEQNDNEVGTVTEISRDGKVRWKIEGLQYPIDARVLGNNRVLITEVNGRRVTERDFKGAILWEKSNLNSPMNAQRLPNGNTFIATHQEMLEVDRTGKTVSSKRWPVPVMSAYKAPNGQIVGLTNQGACIRLDATGKEIKSFPSGGGSGWWSGMDGLPNGHVLIAQHERGQVVEYDRDGKNVWQAQALNLTTASRMPNGNTLVASYNNRTVVELDRAGKTVWEHKSQSRVYRARRR